MRVLIDSHTLIWYVDQDKLLSLTSNASGDANLNQPGG
jgi:PIN domain nuclease of toxin-antitoxin system